MKHESMRALYRYWNELRGGRKAPYRSELDPRAIAPLLESTFILEHTGAATPRFRLAGTRLCDQFGMELRGMSALALWHGDCRARMKDVLAKVVADPCIGHVACTVETRGGYLYNAEFLYLPLRSDLGEMTRILGCGYYGGGGELGLPGQEPIHHWIDSVNVYQIDSFEDPASRAIVIDRGPRPVAPTDRRPTALGVPAAPRAGAPEPAQPNRSARLGAIRPLLRTIEGGRSGESARAGERPDLTVVPTEHPRPQLRIVKSDAV